MPSQTNIHYNYYYDRRYWNAFVWTKRYSSFGGWETHDSHRMWSSKNTQQQEQNLPFYCRIKMVKVTRAMVKMSICRYRRWTHVDSDCRSRTRDLCSSLFDWITIIVHSLRFPRLPMQSSINCLYGHLHCSFTQFIPIVSILTFDRVHSKPFGSVAKCCQRE